MLSINRPPDRRWKVAACWAASVGVIAPGPNATTNRSRDVVGMSAAHVIHASSHHVPVGVSTERKPQLSATRATSCMYSRVAGRAPAGAGAATPPTPAICSALAEARSRP